MSSIFREILDWSEAWAPLIPLTSLLIYRNKTPYLKPIRIYVIVVLVLNVLIDVLDYPKVLGLHPDDFLWNNNFLYNIEPFCLVFQFTSSTIHAQDKSNYSLWVSNICAH